MPRDCLRFGYEVIVMEERWGTTVQRRSMNLISLRRPLLVRRALQGHELFAPGRKPLAAHCIDAFVEVELVPLTKLAAMPAPGRRDA
jgi:hypothetical protein